MLSSRILYVFFTVILCGSSLKANMPDEEFRKLSANLDQTVKALEGQSLSDEQMMTLSGHLMRLGIAIEKARKIKKIAPSTSDKTSWVPLLERQARKGNFFSTPPKSMKPNSNFAVYVHTILDTFIIENNLRPFPIFDAKLAKNKIQDECGNGTHAKTKENKLLLAVEIYFRDLIKKDPNLFKMVKYVGLRKSDKRADGHVRELCNETRCLQSTKASFESSLLDAGVNIGMHTAISNLNEDELKLFEALLARLFRVQLFGASAVIADTAAFDRLGEYHRWYPRIKELKKLGLDRVVEEFENHQLMQILPPGSLSDGC